MVQRPFSLDILQLLRFVLLTLLTAPPNYHWQQFLERQFPAYIAAQQPQYQSIELQRIEEGSQLGTSQAEQAPHGARESFSLRNTLTKWFIDCMTAGAILNTVAFLVIMGILKGHSFAAVWQSLIDVSFPVGIHSGRRRKTDKLKETIPIIVAGYRIWPIASIISFSVVPVSKRIVFLSFVGFIWGIYLSLLAARV